MATITATTRPISNPPMAPNKVPPRCARANEEVDARKLMPALYEKPCM
jgi:hypothetical protein